jgi:hypothetical protein
VWQYGGKNCSAFWFNYSGGGFDVEAADRPLNAYLYPDFTFFAPPPPARLGANDPARLNQQARVFRDPADTNSRQRNWPNPNTPPLPTYDDVGTSYGAQMVWMEQLQGRVPGGLVGAFREGCRRLAVDQGVDPARFLHVTDPVGDVVIYSANPQFQVQGNHGGVNQGVSLFADGHAGLITYRPGAQRASRINAEYSVWFEDLGRPAGRTPAAEAPR